MLRAVELEQAPYKENQGSVTEAPEGEMWMRSHDDVHRTASDIIEELEPNKWVDLACIGAACLNQATKSVAVARERLNKRRLDLLVQPWFSTITDDKDRVRTRLMLRVMKVKIV
jgi:stage V sporulation protein SpoVS